mmetsp:Transcript_6332/g.15624  ORF Transcript_6332/g.15624 Transcript_6332/m.15624 type:complete len:221 (-) Transcript_6332:140-802(-)
MAGSVGLRIAHATLPKAPQVVAPVHRAIVPRWIATQDLEGRGRRHHAEAAADPTAVGAPDDPLPDSLTGVQTASPGGKCSAMLPIAEPLRVDEPQVFDWVVADDVRVVLDVAPLDPPVANLPPVLPDQLVLTDHVAANSEGIRFRFAVLHHLQHGWRGRDHELWVVHMAPLIALPDAPMELLLRCGPRTGTDVWGRRAVGVALPGVPFEAVPVDEPLPLA